MITGSAGLVEQGVDARMFCHLADIEKIELAEKRIYIVPAT
jgi:hypothetical protein